MARNIDTDDYKPKPQTLNLNPLMARSIDTDDYTDELIDVAREHKKELHALFEEARRGDQMAGREHASSPQVCYTRALETISDLISDEPLPVAISIT